MVNATVITQILAICDNTCDAARFRHHLEQLRPHELQAHLAALQQSEEHHAGRWVGGRDIAAPVLNNRRFMGRMAMV